MKKLLIIAIVFALGVITTEAFGQRVVVQGNSVLVQPPGYNVRVNVPQYYRVQPQPYLVTPQVVLPPPKPQFWTPLRNFFWRTSHPVKTYYNVQPVPQQDVQFYRQQPYRPY